MAGRPSEFREDFIPIASEMTLNGAIDQELADSFDVSVTTLNTWKLKYPAFLASIKDGKAKADERIVRTLYQKAIAGDTTAMIFWLKNRKREEWREKQEDSAPPVAKLSEEEIKTRIAELIRSL